MKTTEARYRALLSDEELILYASCEKREPLRLPPLQAQRLNRLLDELEAEAAGGSDAWRVDRSANRRVKVAAVA